MSEKIKKGPWASASRAAVEVKEAIIPGIESLVRLPPGLYADLFDIAYAMGVDPETHIREFVHRISLEHWQGIAPTRALVAEPVGSRRQGAGPRRQPLCTPEQELELES